MSRRWKILGLGVIALAAAQAISTAMVVDVPSIAPPVYVPDKVKVEVVDGKRIFDVPILTLKVTNGNDFMVRDVIVRCRFYAPSGTMLHERYATAWHRFLPNTPQRIEGLSFGTVDPQAADFSCSVADAFRA